MPVKPDGHIILDLKVLSEYDKGDTGLPRWQEEMQTIRFEFYEIETIRFEDWGVTIRLKGEPEELLHWPWTSIIHITHMCNSDEVAKALQKEYNDEQLVRYAEAGAEFLEQVVNGETATATIAVGSGHVHTNSDGVMVGHDIETPCGHMSAVKSSDVEIWTCLTCGFQWEAEV